MKRILFIIVLLTSASAYGQKPGDAISAISLDLASLAMTHNVRLGFSHLFAEKISAEGDVSVQIPEPLKDAEEEEHESLLAGQNDYRKRITKNIRPEFRIGIRLWPRKYLEGGYIGIYGSHSYSSGTDMAVGCGYSLMIWRFFGITAGYELKLLDCIQKGVFRIEGITLRIYYMF